MPFAKRFAAAATLIAIAGAAQTGGLMPGSDRMFNPQPEPPATPTSTGGFDLNPAGKYGFNPQPEPPPKDPMTGMQATTVGK